MAADDEPVRARMDEKEGKRERGNESVRTRMDVEGEGEKGRVDKRETETDDENGVDIRTSTSTEKVLQT